MRKKEIAATVLGGTAAGAAGWLAYSALGVDHHCRLGHAIDAPRRRFRAREAMLSSYAAGGAGRPLALVHSVNAAASAYEMRPLFEHYRGQRPVHALDLPGFGFSDRADRRYSPEFFAGAIQDWLESEVVKSEPADVVALSLGGEFAARAAMERPDLFRSLTLISPTGFSARTGRMPGWVRHLGRGVLAQAFFDALTTPPGIRYYLRKSFEGPIDRGLALYGYASAHQPGGMYAPLDFVSGRLFTPGVAAEVYGRLALPVLALHDRDGYVDFDQLPAFLNRRPNWEAVRIAPTKGLPHFEKPAETAAALDRFWGRLPAKVEIPDRSALS